MCGVTADELQKLLTHDTLASDAVMASMAECHPTFAEFLSLREHWNKDTPEGEKFRADFRRLAPLYEADGVSPLGKAVLSRARSGSAPDAADKGECSE